MTKTATLLLRLADGWCDAPSLCQEFGWKPHTLRAAICSLDIGADRKIQRTRKNGITSYRVIRDDLASDDDGQPSEMQEWQDYDRNC